MIPLDIDIKTGAMWRGFLQSVLGVCVFGLVGSQDFSHGGAPVITSVHQPLLVREGSSFTLNCRASGAFPMEYKWLKNGAGITGFSSSGSHSIATATRHAGGSYRCLSKNSHGAALSQISNVTIAYLNSFESDSSVLSEVRSSRNGYFILRAPPLDAAPMDDIRWQWYFYDSVIFPNVTHFASQNGDLVVLDTHRGYAGQYRLEASHPSFPGRIVRSPIFRVSVEGSYQFQDGDPKIVLPPRRHIYRRNPLSGQDSFVLECVGHSSDLNDLQIVWRHNGSIIPSDQFRYEIRDFGRHMIVKNPGYRREGGQYTCEARRGSVSSAPRETWVEVHEAPVITLPLSPITTGALGQQTELPCRAEGYPPPTFKWYLNGVDLKEELNCCPDNPPLLLGRDGSLLITSVSKRNTGIYQCEPYNDAGGALSFTWLRTEAKGPRFSLRPQNVSVPAGHRAELICQAVGAPPPLITWKVNGSRINTNGLHYRLEGTTLVIPVTAQEHTGWYTCVATNTEGENEVRAYLNVAGRTQIVRGPIDQSAVIGSNVLFPCQVSQEAGRGRFTRSWYFNGQLLTAGSSRTIDLRHDGTLSITQVGPSKIGTYTCTVTSPFGTQSESATLKIVEKPGMPLHVKSELMIDTLPAKIRVSWTQGFDGNSPIIKYLLQHRILGIRELWSDWETAIENIGREQNSAIVDNLKPSSVYEFRVIAVNRFGPGIPSIPSNNVTLPQQPPAAAPRSVAGSARSSSSIMVQWQPPPPEQWNGDILGYFVRYRLANYPDIPWLRRNVSDSRARNVLLEDLITWREYEIQVSAFNERGMGVFSKSQYITTLEGVPAESPTNVNATVINSTAIYVEFTPPPQQMIPGVNLGYKVEAWKGPTGTGMLAREVRVLPYSVNRISTTLNELEKYVAYNVTTLCYTAPGDGPHSTPITLRTKEDIPGPVRNMRFDEVLFSSVKVVWDPPGDPNGILLNYTLSYWVTNQSSTTRQTFVVSPDKTSFKVTQLSPSTHYSFELFAETIIGKGPTQTATMESGVPPELPGPPKALIVSNVKAESASLQFLPGFDGKTIITRWIVEGQIGSSTSWLTVYNVSDPRATSILLTGLRPYTIYRLRLIAENVVGKSPPSEAAESFQTLQAPPQGPPSDFSAEPFSPNAIAVSWTPLQSYAWNGVPKGYMLKYRKNSTSPDTSRRGSFGLSFNPNNINDAPFQEQKILDPSASEYILQSLQPYTAYDVSILPFNDFGSGVQSEIQSARTYEGKPSESPTNVQAIAESPTSGRITWSQVPREYWNGKILGFKIRYSRESGGVAESDEVEVLGVERRDFLLDNLTPFAQYRIQVAAFTIMGIGPANKQEVVLQTKEDTPGPPSEVKFHYVSLDTVRITWGAPYKPNGIINRYQVAHWRNSSDPQSAIRTQVGRDLHFYSANGLQSQTVYAFAVSAETSIGWGQEAKVYVYTTTSKVPPSSPSEAKQDTNQLQGPSQVSLRWNVLSTFTAPVRLIDIEYQRANEGEWVRWQERIPGTVKRASVTGLAANTAYRFRLKAENDFGLSQWSTESAWIKTLQDSPNSSPLDVTAIPYDASAIKIGWAPPPLESWNSDFLGYRILYKPYNQDDAIVQTQELPMGSFENTAREYVIKGLPRFRHYIVQLQSFNRRGSSPFSPPVFVYVGYSVPKTSVTNLRADNRSSTQFNVFWDPWPETNEPVSGFKVRYIPTNSVNGEWREDVVKNGASRIILHELKKYTEYNIRVFPFNKAGEGPPADVMASTPEDRPGPVGQLVFSDIMLDSVNVSWAPPHEPNGEITGYIVYYETYKNEIEYGENVHQKVKRNYMRATNLETNITYTFWVKAETAVGYGPRVAGKVRIGPQPGSPEAPKDLQVIPRDTSVGLVWTNPNQGASAITSHIIQVQRLNTQAVKTREKRQSATGPTHPKGEWTILTTVESGKPKHSVSYDDLERTAEYIFRVFSRNSHGVSPPSPASKSIKVPEKVETAFYLQWWFLVILGLLSVLIIVCIVACLWATGRNNKYKYEKRNSADSLQLADGGIVTYELRASQRARNALQKHNNTYARQPPRPDPNKGWREDGTGSNRGVGRMGVSGEPIPPPTYGSVIRGPGSTASIGSHNRIGPVASLYDSLAVGTVVPTHTGFPPAATGSRRGSHQHHLDHTERTDVETSTTGEDEESEVSDRDEQDVSSIVQHYQTSDVAYRETWRRAKQREAHRPSSISSQSENVSVRNGSHYDHTHNGPGSRAPVPGFSSFV